MFAQCIILFRTKTCNKTTLNHIFALQRRAAITILYQLLAPLPLLYSDSKIRLKCVKQINKQVVNDCTIPSVSRLVGNASTV